uniref:Uncharacterized protein n=1 Tax=Angiostrongylus cantonensis TaxID=6313 RepID=A0A0K0CUM2_ANGCA
MNPELHEDEILDDFFGSKVRIGCLFMFPSEVPHRSGHYFTECAFLHDTVFTHGVTMVTSLLYVELQFLL